MPLLKAVATLLFGGLAVVVILVVIGAVLAFSGSPEPCIDRESVPSTAASDELDAAWRAFHPPAAAGPAAPPGAPAGGRRPPAGRRLPRPRRLAPAPARLAAARRRRRSPARRAPRG